MKNLSSLVTSVPASPTTMMMQRGRELKAAGKDVVSLAGGEPDFDTPRHIIEAGYAAVQAGDTHYPPSPGTPALLKAIVEKLKRENDVHHITHDDIMVTPGAKWALFATLAALLEPGDEVLVLDPSWVSYSPMVLLQRGVPISVPLCSADGFCVTADALERHITPKTKLLMVNSPNNPTGRVLTRAEIDAIVYVACRHDLYVLSDEIYEHITFDDHVHHSLAAEPGMAERTIVVNGFSKAYAMTGWRLGWLAGPRPIVKLARIYQTHSAQSAASFTMAAGVAALTGPQDCIKEMVAVYDKRRKLVLEAFDEIPGIQCPPVEGAFYVFPKFTHSKKSSLEITQALIDEALVVSTPGSAFGEAGEGHVRFSIAERTSDLEKMVDRLAKVASRL
jgi:aspartate aminotransferase